MPNRMIKDTIRTSKSVNAMTDFQFRLWIYLITYVDDYGRGSADPELLKGFVFPRRKNVTEATIEKTLADLATMGSIVLYEVGGESYLYFPNWSDHQRIQTKKSKFPTPESGSQKSTVIHRESPPESNPNQTEYELESESKPKKKDARVATRFTPPTVEEVQAYCFERRNSIDAQQFFDFYTSKGWKIGKNDMKDWRSAVRTWERRENHTPPPGRKLTRAEELESFYNMAKEWSDE